MSKRSRSAATSRCELVDRRAKLVVVGRARGRAAAEELLDHLRRPREQVAEVVPELALVALVEAVDRGAAVLAER